MRFRSDTSQKQSDNAILWFARWLGGPTLAKIENCLLANLAGNMRRTVQITGHPDSYFSIPAECSIAGARVCEYVTCDDEGNHVFRHTYY